MSQQLFDNLYTYDSGLRHDRIRLIELLPGRWDDNICCDLYLATLSDKPRYRALSYVWGSQKNMQPIWVNRFKMFITANLERGLRRLRDADQPVVLWVDAISINQSDDAERTQQVQLMKHIFTCSEEVIIYLGEVLRPAFAISMTHTSSEIIHTRDEIFFGD